MTKLTQIPTHTAMFKLSLIQVDSGLSDIILTPYQVARTHKASEPIARALASINKG